MPQKHSTKKDMTLQMKTMYMKGRIKEEREHRKWLLQELHEVEKMLQVAEDNGAQSAATTFRNKIKKL